VSSWAHAGLPTLPPTPGSAAALVAAYRAGRTDPVEALSRLEARLAAAPDLAASIFSDLCPQRARGQAAAAAERYRRGCPRGPLDGVPIGLKDQHDLAGLPTRAGAAGRGQPVARDGVMVQRLVSAGVVLPGKTRSTLWGMCPAGRALDGGLPRNPHDLERVAGGSSTGSGVAVCLGLTPAAVGSDAGGSVRIPAALMGLFGLLPRPEPALEGDVFGRCSLMVNGPIAADTADLATLLAAMRPQDRGARDPMAALGRGVRGCRIALIREAWREAHGGFACLGDAVVRGLESDGASVTEMSAGPLSRSRAVGAASVIAETRAGLAVERTRGELPAPLLALLDAELPDPEVIAGERAATRRWLSEVLEQVDLLALPTTMVPAPRYLARDGSVPFLDDRDNALLCTWTFSANLAGLAAGTIPAGTVDGLPMGLQLVGRDEAAVLAVMAHVQRVGLAVVPRPVGWAGLEPR
jgi:aspartyl-tRNA(Asn)/glutamyl-tRNA(Gln) amidotransferase subunit A